MKIYPTLRSAHVQRWALENSLGKGVDFWMLFLENTNNVVRPCSDGSDNDDESKSRTETEGIKHRWDTQDTQSNLGLGL